MSPQKEGIKVIISGKPVQMVYPLKMHGEKNPLPVKTCIEAMRGYGRCHTTRNFEPYKAYNFKEGDLAIAYSGNQQAAFRVGRQYRITPDLISDPNYQQVWASNEKHSYKELLNFQSQPNVWGLFMEPLGDYIEGRIVPFPTVEPHIFETTTKTTAASSELISTEPTNLVLAVHNGQPGGTQKCIDYAVRQGKAIVVYNPQTEKFTKLGNWPTAPTRATPKQPSRQSIDHER